MRCEKGTISMQAIINHEVPFNVPPCVGDEIGYVQEAIEANRKICGDGPFTKKCNEWLENRFSSNKVLLTTSGTSALEMAAILCDLKPGDEVILLVHLYVYRHRLCACWCEARVCGYSSRHDEYRRDQD